MGVWVGRGMGVTVGGTGVGGGTVGELVGAAVQPAMIPASRMASTSAFNKSLPEWNGFGIVVLLHGSIPHKIKSGLFRQR
jgi:hypothetical protein